MFMEGARWVVAWKCFVRLLMMMMRNAGKLLQVGLMCEACLGCVLGLVACADGLA